MCANVFILRVVLREKNPLKKSGDIDNVDDYAI